MGSAHSLCGVSPAKAAHRGSLFWMPVAFSLGSVVLGTLWYAVGMKRALDHADQQTRFDQVLPSNERASSPSGAGGQGAEVGASAQLPELEEPRADLERGGADPDSDGAAGRPEPKPEEPCADRDSGGLGPEPEPRAAPESGGAAGSSGPSPRAPTTAPAPREVRDWLDADHKRLFLRGGLRAHHASDPAGPAPRPPETLRSKARQDLSHVGLVAAAVLRNYGLKLPKPALDLMAAFVFCRSESRALPRGTMIELDGLLGRPRTDIHGPEDEIPHAATAIDYWGDQFAASEWSLESAGSLTNSEVSTGSLTALWERVVKYLWV
uniref:Uncharacterized protein n=1 Tax=Pyrodinium bahamense TaxID=73915 RepID=A0A7S0B8F1_9DINO|mmetsp:Transcript_54742/g.151851  ORF Transcript_54742/g.151851 Transcript_54742/m.151851 type:complete len:323 (+) Transcript_54742:42-1010(+)